MVIIDVREREEFEAEHVPGSILLPMSQLNTMAPGLLKNIPAEEITVMCRTGNRARLAIEELKKLGYPQRFSCYEGGILKWKTEGKEVTGTSSVFPIMRQVQILASSMIFLSFALASLVHPSFVYLSLFVGFGLGISGWIGFCPSVILLKLMPWNKR